MPDPWIIELCESDRASEGKAYRHAARAVRPIAGGRQVEYGYGETESGAIDDVRRRCAEIDQPASDDDVQQQKRNPFVSTWGPAKGCRWHEGM